MWRLAIQTEEAELLSEDVRRAKASEERSRVGHKIVLKKKGFRGASQFFRRERGARDQQQDPGLKTRAYTERAASELSLVSSHQTDTR